MASAELELESVAWEMSQRDTGRLEEVLVRQKGRQMTRSPSGRDTIGTVLTYEALNVNGFEGCARRD